MTYLTTLFWDASFLTPFRDEHTAKLSSQVVQNSRFHVFQFLKNKNELK